MSRIINAPVQVTVGPQDGELAPVAFRYLTELHRVQEVLDTWTMAEPWWDDPGAVGRAPRQAVFWRVVTSRGGVFELVQEASGEWRLWKAYD